MPNLIAFPEDSSQTTPPQHVTSSSKASTRLWRTRYFTIFFLAFTILSSITTASKSSAFRPATVPTSSATILPLPPATQNVQQQASLIRDNLPSYLYFVSTEVLPVMSKNIDDILYNLKGLTDIRSGFFYHAHIDYSMIVPGGIEGLMDINNVVLQYHTLENPQLQIQYWRKALGNIHDPNIDAWLKRVNEYHRDTSTPSAASGVQYIPLTAYEAVNIASSWDEYLRQNMLPSPGIETLMNMVYLIDGGEQPRYQESFKNIYRLHSIAFNPEGYLLLDNRTHLESTFSPIQINFERIEACQALLPVFEEAKAAEFSYILNPNNEYIAQHPELLRDPEMGRLSKRLLSAITRLPDDNMIKKSSSIPDQQIGFFVAGDYIFAVSGSLDSPSIFK